MAADLARFTGVLIFVRRYCTQYDSNYIIQTFEIFFGFVYLFPVCIRLILLNAEFSVISVSRELIVR